jgi:epoxyqueuosine reductase QueG
MHNIWLERGFLESSNEEHYWDNEKCFMWSYRRGPCYLNAQYSHCDDCIKVCIKVFFFLGETFWHI